MITEEEQKLIVENASLKEDLENLKGEIDNLEGTITDLEDEVINLKREKDHLENDVDDLENEVSELLTKIEELEETDFRLINQCRQNSTSNDVDNLISFMTEKNSSLTDESIFKKLAIVYSKLIK